MSDGPIRLLPTIYNIKDFLNQKHPTHHPDSYKYEKYWTEQEKYCLEGKWGFDSVTVETENGPKQLGGWRYMPGNLYFYINMWTIIRTERKARVRISPSLRDVEWILSYAWMSARGFSGFEDDEEYTCNINVLRDISDEELLTLYAHSDDPEESERLKKNLFHKGKRKKYKEAFSYLKQTFDKPLGRAIWGNPSLNLMVLGSRNFGKSFYTSGAILGHEFYFDGHKYYDEKYLTRPNEINIFVGAFNSDKSSELLTMFKNGAANLPGSYGSGDDYRPSFFYKNTTGTLVPNNKQSVYKHSYKVKQGGIWVDKGTKSSITHGVYTVDNAQAAVGSRFTVMVLEEIGLFRNFLASVGSNNLCLTDGIDRFGSTIAIGTGGNMETIQEPRMVFYDPDPYDFYGFDNPFEVNSKKCGLFIPGYYALNQYKDSQGNTKLQEAYDYLMNVRESKRKATTNMALNDELMSRPIVPSEMFLSNVFSNFPIQDLRERYAELETTNEYSDSAQIGTLEYVDEHRKKVKWYLDKVGFVNPIVTINMDLYNGDFSGGIIVYEHPIEGKPDPTYINPLYRIVYDPVRDDEYGPSLGSILVYKGYENENWEGRMSDNIVAECLMRTQNTEDIHETVIKLALYYGAKVMPETNMPDFIRYCKTRNLYHILQPAPTEALSKALVGGGNNKYAVGVTMVPNLGKHCENLIANWLSLPYKEENGRLYSNVYKIKSKRLLEELINYKRQGNFDHVSSLKILMLWLSQDAERKKPEDSEERDYLTLKKKLHSARRENKRNVVREIFYNY